MEALKYFLIEFFGCINTVAIVWFIVSLIFNIVVFTMCYIFKIVSLDSDDDDVNTIDNHFMNRIVRNKKLMSKLIISLIVSTTVMIVAPSESTAKKMFEPKTTIVVNKVEEPPKTETNKEVEEAPIGTESVTVTDVGEKV